MVEMSFSRTISLLSRRELLIIIFIQRRMITFYSEYFIHNFTTIYLIYYSKGGVFRMQEGMNSVATLKFLIKIQLFSRNKYLSVK